ncbi:hypothetical protein CAOG_01967 [Capsaspora owczarzaki ATCC 30864]|uniref:Uncharacterized protein n=1 Tax=Capsaspora owczarzaki (strain ATCC 30864) TaxID=595528 RepID=A0A0D2WKE0_CAPO3|nr:hypothetical protein CAOG_01967 [Capsaspora owczarzaki ATCC 30864]KJE90700.1 hypothetical protein CAOG_001967 [Capsaspora owczarzaki ATCC 30864]|eukprot:XP_004364835.2 hypothetical protein CAOG_01967 [Capsaspora owczarzaki ATCC 30864]
MALHAAIQRDLDLEEQVLKRLHTKLTDQLHRLQVEETVLERMASEQSSHMSTRSVLDSLLTSAVSTPTHSAFAGSTAASFGGGGYAGSAASTPAFKAPYPSSQHRFSQPSTAASTAPGSPAVYSNSQNGHRPLVPLSLETGPRIRPSGISDISDAASSSLLAADSRDDSMSVDPDADDDDDDDDFDDEDDDLARDALRRILDTELGTNWDEDGDDDGDQGEVFEDEDDEDMM